MSQHITRLFEKWLNAGDGLTFSEWLTERREIAQRRRDQQRVGAVIPIGALPPPAYFLQQALLQNSFARQQQAAMQGIAGWGGLGSALGNLLQR